METIPPEQEIKRFEEEGYRYLPKNERRGGGLIEAPSGRAYATSQLEEWVKKAKLIFGDGRKIELLRASTYLYLLKKVLRCI